MSIVECGCNGQLSGHLLDGEPYIERTTDIGFCALHAAAPALLAALKGSLDVVTYLIELALDEHGQAVDAERVRRWSSQAREAIREAKGEA